MATATGEDETDYESDPDEAKLSLAMRRREASDDEEDEEDVEDRPRRTESRVVIVSDGEYDGQGAAAEYDDEQFGDEDEEEVEDVVDGERKKDYGSVDGGERGGIGLTKEVEGVRAESVVDDENGALADGDQVVGEEKKQNEPFSVPTAGAFYMHDDRFRDNAGGRNRRNFGARNLWESRDDRRWGHDKFEEMTTPERHYERGQRGTRGRHRARGRNPGSGRGYPRGNGSMSYNNENTQNHAPKSVRGRGPRRYEPSTSNKNEASISQNKQFRRSREKASHANSGRVITSTSTENVESEPAPVKNNMVASSLNSASRPFYPSGASNNHVNLTPKRDLQTGNTNNNLQPSTQSSALPRGKNVVGSVGMEKLNISGQRTESSNALAEKGKGGVQGNGRGSFLYNSPQVLGVAGNIGVGRGDPNFPGVPPFFPAMQFGGQHPGGMGVPAVAMAYPGYVGQPQGGNSEIKWLSVLAGTSGALGATYPYIAVDNAYHALPSEQTYSSSSSSKEITDKANSNEWKLSQRPEHRGGNEPVQRQNKPRRYSEMNFGQ